MRKATIPSGGVLLAALLGMLANSALAQTPLDDEVQGLEPSEQSGVHPAPVRTPPGDRTLYLPERQVHESSVDLFRRKNWYVAPVRPKARARTVLPSAPVAPPLPYTYLGSFSQEGEDTLYIVVKGDTVQELRIGDVIDGTYSVDRVRNGQLIFTYLPLNVSQSLTLRETQ